MDSIIKVRAFALTTPFARPHYYSGPLIFSCPLGYGEIDVIGSAFQKIKDRP